jgi:DNA polymerase I-like protein with 3'-5' exonuclease and polymerase domains
MITEWITTPTGRRSLKRANLMKVIKDPDLLVKLSYRSALTTAMNTFMIPWMEFAAEDGRLHTTWNQVRSDKATRDMAGARTGRLSSMEPNFTNVMTEQLWQPEGWPSLPYMRQYLLPEEGHVWLKRDWSAQEMRWAAEFSDGSLLQAFIQDPATDPHNFVKNKIHEMMGKDLPRKHVKETGFQILYGGGATAISGKLNVPYEEGQSLKKTYFAAMPELEDLSKDCNNRGKRGGYIRTWGGRVYYPEPPAFIDGRYCDFSYKLINYLMQGSAADQIKETTCNWEEVRGKDTQLQALVHDEMNISAPEEEAEVEMAKLKKCMNAPIADVPFLSEGFRGPNWHDLTEMA